MTIVMVLGLLLKFNSMSGYEIQQKMQSAQTDKWAYVQPASIYHALRKLQSEKLVVLDTLEHTGNRSKAIYRITDKGRKEFHNLLLKSFKKSSVVFPAPLYTVLTFFDEVPSEELQKALEEQRQAIISIYDEMKKGEQQKTEQTEVSKNVRFIFENIYAQCELQLDFLDQLQKHLLSK